MWTEEELTQPKSRRYAIETGRLVDVSYAAQTVGYVRKIALSREVWNECVAHRGDGAENNAREWLDDLVKQIRLAESIQNEMRALDPTLPDPASPNGSQFRAIVRQPNLAQGKTADELPLMVVFNRDDRGWPSATVIPHKEKRRGN